MHLNTPINGRRPAWVGTPYRSLRKGDCPFCSAIYISSKVNLSLDPKNIFFNFFDVVKYNGLYL